MSIHPVQPSRYFTFDKRYSEVDWAKFPEVVAAFRSNLEYWYVLPALRVRPESHFGFAVLASTCMLIDALSQYELGKKISARSTFKSYLRLRWPAFGVQFATPIQDGEASLMDYADVIYGVRCGVLHENHIPLYAGLVAQNQMVDYHSTGFATYNTGADCPVVTIDPGRLFDEVQGRFESYLTELVDPDSKFDALRRNFQEKFEVSFGVNISIVV